MPIGRAPAPNLRKLADVVPGPEEYKGSVHERAAVIRMIRFFIWFFIKFQIALPLSPRKAGRALFIV
jgi:hypothetical protein